MTNKSMQFLYGDRELLITVTDMLTTVVDVIVNGSDPDLLLDESSSQRLIAATGHVIQSDLHQLRRQYGAIEPGMAVYSTAGDLPYAAVIHCVNPQQQDADESQYVLEQSITRSLLLCETNDWRSIAFPALGVETGAIAIERCAQAFFRAITHFWDARHECVVEKIILCLEQQELPLFFSAFRNDALETAEPDHEVPVAEDGDEEGNIGVIDLQEEDINQADEEVDSWFK